MQDMLAMGGRYGRVELCVFPVLVFPPKWVSSQTYILPFTGRINDLVNIREDTS